MANLGAGTSGVSTRALGGEYQVFLSFRGPDTRHGFTDFLYHSLIDAGVHVFKENDELCVGKVISEDLLYAIDNSILYIPIFSQTYASSKWCLQELALIVDNVSKSKDQKSIIPIFFDVEPEDVKLRTSIYSSAFSKHKEDFPQEVEVWRKALVGIDEIQGWNVRNGQSQAAIVKSIVEEVLKKLEIKQTSVIQHLVGLDDRVKQLIELLDVDNWNVQLIGVGIYGKSGIGKTTIAKVIFNKLSSHFGMGCSFLENVRESSLTKEGIIQSQRKLMCDIVGSRSAKQLLDSEQAMERIGDTLRTKKVLIVLDDVDKKEHIKKLTGGYSLHPGSRIIITTRNRIVLNVKGFEDKIIPYEMLKMDKGLALQLFCHHAFARGSPLDDYGGLSSKIVSSTGGLPLVVEVIGSLLNGKNEPFWKETLDRLREVPDEDILETLKISYSNLDKHQQQIFLDISCFLFNENKTDASYMWADCQFYPIRGLKVLTARRLISILDNNKIWMHDQLVDLGRRIVRQESPFNPGKRSRLWIAKEALEIIKTKERKDEVQALKLCGSNDSTEITKEDFERLQNLRFLELNWGTYAGDFARCHSNLRWLSWYSPWDFRADNMYMDHLAVCKLDVIDFKDDSKAWDLVKRAHNLKVLSVTRCSGITTIPNFSKCSRLERLTVANCFGLERIESFIGDLESLIELKIEECRGLTYLPEEVGALVKLKHFSLSGCRGLRELPRSLENLTSLTELDLSDTLIRELPKSIGKLKLLRVLRLPIGALVYREDHVWQLPSGISTLVNLEELDLSRRKVTGEIPDGIGGLSSLTILKLERTHICRIPTTINRLQFLQTLNLRLCHEIQVLPELPTSLTCLLLRSKSLLSVPNLSNLTNLVELLLSNDSSLARKSNLIPGCKLWWIGNLCRLKKLELDLLNVPAPPELASLSHLEELKLSCLDLENLMQHPPSFWSLRNLTTLEFHSCELEDVPLNRLPRLEEVTVYRCKWLQRLSIPLELSKLRQVRVSRCPELVNIQVERLLKSFESLKVYECESLTKIVGLSYSMNLEYLRIQRCKQLTDVEGLNELKSLRSLEVTHCPSLRRLIDASCTNIPDNCLVNIQECGDSIKDSTPSDPPGTGMPLLRYVQESLPQDTSNFKSESDKFKVNQMLSTNGFHNDSLIGSGGFGDVYKAQLKDGSVVAIKKLIHVSGQGDREFTAEMETIGKIKHRNLVSLLGYCKVKEERLLVYEYMKYGSLEDVLHDQKKTGIKLKWAVRRKIAVGAARGLAFLHHNCIPHIIHRDMKSSNVLLDENLEARVSDFGMARLTTAMYTHLSVSTLAGTPGYVPPEYYQSFRCSTKGDVYSYGVVLLELLTGKRPTDSADFGDNNLVGWVKQHAKLRISDVFDQMLIKEDPNLEIELLQHLKVARACLVDQPWRRPTMIQVLAMFKEIQAGSGLDSISTITTDDGGFSSVEMSDLSIKEGPESGGTQ